MKIIKFPSSRQTYAWDCGAKALQALLLYYGLDVREDEIIKESGMTKGGMKITEIKKFASSHDYKILSKKMSLADIKKYIDKKTPVILALQAWSKKKKISWENNWSDGHYVIAIGYDQNKIYFADPASPHIVYLTLVELEKRWHDQDRAGKKYINFGLVVIDKKPNYQPNKFIHLD